MGSLCGWQEQGARTVSLSVFTASPLVAGCVSRDVPLQGWEAILPASELVQLSSHAVVSVSLHMLRRLWRYLRGSERTMLV